MPGTEPSSRLLLSVAAAQQAGLAPLRHTACTGSTNDDLVEEARRGVTGTCVLVADHQTAGRGRMGRRWSDAAGSLLVSFRIPGPLAGASGRVAAVSAAALTAAASAVHAEAASPSPAVLSKWPNDLVVESASASLSGKLAGVLAEAVDGAHPAVVVGLGLNLEPVPDEPRAVCLRQLGARVTRDELLASLLYALGQFLRDPAGAWLVLRRSSATLGRRVRVELPDGTVFTGLASAIDGQGRLVVETAGGARIVQAADVSRVRAGC